MRHDAKLSDAPTITSTSLILRIQARDQIAWDRFTRLYTPYVYGLCRANGLQQSDAEDVTQNVLRSIVSGIGSYQRTGSFRGWISQITRNRIIDHHRIEQRMPIAEGGTDFQLRVGEVPDEQTLLSSQSAIGGDPLVMRALDLIREEFEPTTWTAFWRMVVEGHSAGEIANDLGWIDSVNSASRAKGTKRVRQAKFRVMKRIREEFGEVLDLNESPE
jgi:RNA polymerase sigma-70 factor (ECF subfamily)